MPCSQVFTKPQYPHNNHITSLRTPPKRPKTSTPALRSGGATTDQRIMKYLVRGSLILVRGILADGIRSKDLRYPLLWRQHSPVSIAAPIPRNTTPHADTSAGEAGITPQFLEHHLRAPFYNTRLNLLLQIGGDRYAKIATRYWHEAIVDWTQCSSMRVLWRRRRGVEVARGWYARYVRWLR